MGKAFFCSHAAAVLGHKNLPYPAAQISLSFLVLVSLPVAVPLAFTVLGVLIGLLVLPLLAESLPGIVGIGELELGVQT